ncbi:TPA: hypothetical protein HA242_07275 [Candidatus Woesearchaeota archaeon]|nr:hypothetical protein [Candidatus Woesearchaeota archaeon]
MEDIIANISKENEFVPTIANLSGNTFGHFFRPMVETTLAVGKFNAQPQDPLIIVSPKGMLCIAKTVREQGDGEGAVYFLSKTITSDKTSYICIDFNRQFLDFCRAVRGDDVVQIGFNQEFYFLNITRAREEKPSGLSEKSLYRAQANSLQDIQQEMHFTLNLLSQAPPTWTGKMSIPAKEIKKFYQNIWRYQHRAVFYHIIQNNNALAIAYSEDALREMFDTTLADFGIETPKRRFFMSRQFVSGEDGIRCSGEGSGTFRANFKVLSDLANTGLDFEFSFGTLGTPYGITVRNEKNCFRMICENTIQDETRLQQDLRKTLLGLVSMKPISIEQFETPLLEERK